MQTAKSHLLIILLITVVVQACSPKSSSKDEAFDILFKNCAHAHFSDWVVFYSKFDSLQGINRPVDYALLLKNTERGLVEKRVNIDSFWSSNLPFNSIYSPVYTRTLLECIQSQSLKSKNSDLNLIVQLLSQPLTYEATGKMDWDAISTFNKNFSNTFLQKYIMNYLIVYQMSRVNVIIDVDRIK